MPARDLSVNKEDLSSSFQFYIKYSKNEFNFYSQCVSLRIPVILPSLICTLRICEHFLFSLTTIGLNYRIITCLLIGLLISTCNFSEYLLL